MLNQARLKVLKVREDHVRNVLEDARKRLGDVTRDQGRYREILESLILQGLYQVGRKKFIENFLSIFFFYETPFSTNFAHSTCNSVFVSPHIYFN